MRIEKRLCHPRVPGLAKSELARPRTREQHWEHQDFDCMEAMLKKITLRLAVMFWDEDFRGCSLLER